MNTPDTPARLAYILAHPRVRELRPDWYDEKYGCCPDCVLGGSDNIYSPDLCGDCGRQLPSAMAPCVDLAHPDNLGKLLALADEVAGEPVCVTWCSIMKDYTCDGADCATTRTDAVIAALYRALGGEG